MNRKIVVSVIVLALAALLIGSALAGPKKKAWLGVYTQAVDHDLADAFDLSIKYGAIVNSVIGDSPAEKAGLQDDDIIISINGERITDDVDLQYTIQSFEPGDEITLTVMRDSDKVDLTATLDRSSSSEKTRRWTYNGSGSNWNHTPYQIKIGRDAQYSYIGVELTDVSRGVARSLGADGFGVLINEVEKDSPAEEAGLLPGDLIVMIDGDEVDGPGDVSEIIRSFDEGEKVQIEVVRERKQLSFEIEIAATSRRLGSRHLLRLPDLPTINFDLPHMNGLHWLDFDDDMFNSDEFKDEMNQLRKELEEMRLELNELRGDKD